jgi:hypothetical protein
MSTHRSKQKDVQIYVSILNLWAIRTRVKPPFVTRSSTTNPNANQTNIILEQPCSAKSQQPDLPEQKSE